MRKVFILLPIIFLLCLAVGKVINPKLAKAQSTDSSNDYSVATVTEIIREERFDIDGQTFYVQEVEVMLNDTEEVRTVSSGSEFQPLNENQRLKIGSEIIVSEQEITESESELVVIDSYRLPILIALASIFCILVIVIGGKQGVFSIAGMVASLFVLVSFIIPRILSGGNPFFITLVGATFTAVVTMYISHGLKRQTHIALFSMLICLAAAAFLSTAVVELGYFVGLGSEDAAFLQFGTGQRINLRGLLLAGILLGTLGILDDITLSQTAVIEQLKAVNKKIGFAELYTRGLAVGKDHVASLVNTLVFAYAGTSLPLFLLFTLYQNQPTWVIVNSEVIAEEIFRTLIGSIALVMAVPITTAIAAYYVTNAKTVKFDMIGHNHSKKL